MRLHALLIGDHHADADAFGLRRWSATCSSSAIRGVYADAARTGQVPCESYLREQLVERAKAEARAPEGSAEVAATYRSLAERLHAFCGEGSYGYLLDRADHGRPGDGAAGGVRHARGAGGDLAGGAVRALRVPHRPHRAPPRGAPALAAAGEGGPFAGRFVLVLEELWKLTERRATGAWLNEQARRARHAGLFLVCVTQQRSDLAGPWGKALLDNSTMQLLLRQSPDELAYLRDALKLADAEVEIVAHLRTDKRRAAQAYFINGTRGRGVVSVRLGPRAYWIATSEPIEDAPARERALRDAGGDPWTALDLLAGVDGEARAMSVPGLAAPALAGLGARAARFAALAALGLLLLVLLGVLAVFGSEYERRHPRVQESPGSGIPPVYLPVYAAAEHAYGVNRWLLASIHLQESDFSRLRARSLVGDAVSSGWNGCGAAGPMQMGIVGVAPYGATTAGGCSAGPTWAAYRRAFARAARERPARYPQERAELPACARVRARDGCVYDDFDAILGAAQKLRADGASRDLDAAGTRRAVCAYIGSCLAADTYYGVLPRAKAWEAAALAARPLPQSGGVGAAGLIWPVRGPVVSPYGMRWGAMHEGIDIGSAAGTPILAAQDGQVVLRQWFGGYGEFTCVRHAVELTTCYGHQSRPLVRIGERVRRGQRIGLVGCTGHCFGPHLHFEVHLAGTWSNHERDVDPVTFLPRR